MAQTKSNARECDEIGVLNHTNIYFCLVKIEKYYYDNEAIKEPAKDWGTRDRTNGKYHNEGTGLTTA